MPPIVSVGYISRTLFKQLYKSIMDRVTIVFCAMLLLTSFLVEVTNADTHNDERSLDAYSKRKSNALWFGPRLGRRKRNQNVDYFKTPVLEREQIEALMDILQDSPWIIIAVNGKRHVNQKPGRDSLEDLSNTGTTNDRWLGRENDRV